MEILPKGTPENVPERLMPFIADWATVSYTRHCFGNVLLQAFLHRHYRIYIYRFITGQPGTIHLRCPLGTVVLQLATLGPVKSYIKGYGESLLQTGQFNFFYLPAGMHAYQLEAGEYELVQIIPDGSLLEELAASRDDLKALLTHLRTASEQGCCLTPRQMNYRVQDVLTTMLQSKEAGGNLLMELSTGITNLLNLYRKSLNDAEYMKKLRASYYTPTLITIREEIAQNPHIQQHTLAYFARKYNMSQSTLKRYFKETFQQTLHEFVREECMKKAAWMRGNAAMSLDDIADEVGYADKSGFLKSFKKYRRNAS
jgi:AraC-like DNA-binding protein